MLNKDCTNLELLAPAGSLEKMKYAICYGADAVYAGVPDFSLRARINAFTFETLKEGVEYAHKFGKQFYVTLNIYAHNQHFSKLEKHLKELQKINIDGIILSDPGVLELVKQYLPKVEIHLSTQANATNWRAVKFWAGQGVRRIVLAREVTLEEIKEIHQQVPEVELEYFVHGAMCMSYSGRCILSKWMSGRSANLGDCSQPCRWAFNNSQQTKNNEQRIVNNKQGVSGNTKQMTVEDHQGEFEMDLEEDNNGTYFFNSKDLNLLAHLQDLIDAGITSFKIEGRNKSVYYLATVVRAYRNVLDNLGNENILREELENLNDLVHRGYTVGFLLGEEPEHNFKNSHNKSEWEFVGEMLGTKNEKQKVKSENTELETENKDIKEKNTSLIKIKVHNAIYFDDKVEMISPNGNYPIKILGIYDEESASSENKMKKVKSAHGGHKEFYYLEVDKKNIELMSVLRKKIKN